ncbi:calcium-binding protein [Neptunicoccus sediminis]|uniref:calcium-binding protein n=1 Tax=Neptunicoccus sediminis TaxID=1892596 RepID=UPI0008461912|nr:M10 family metallopeptidase C-terminal domain-containing protein [Neptunicoccus sediminis]
MFLTDTKDLESWANYISSLVAFTGRPDLTGGFDWTAISKMTVGAYLDLLDTVETALAAFDWSFLNSLLPTIRTNLATAGLSGAEIDAALGVLEDFISGDTSLISEGFDFVREALAGYADETDLITALSGGPVDSGIRLDGDGGADDFTGTAFDDFLSGAGGNDKLVGLGGKDYLLGGGGNDKLRGGAGKDKLDGGKGRDKLEGGSGNDTLKGGGGADVLKGGGGKDKIIGGPGNDKLWGNRGADDFIFKSGDGKDTIKDFKVGQDEINLAGADVDDITFIKKGEDVLLRYDDIKVLVENVTRAEMMDDDNFI